MEEPDIVDEILDDIHPLQPNKRGRASSYYVSEANLRAGVTELYETGNFPDALAADLLKMCKRIVTSRRFFSYSDTLREEMVSAASIKVCTQLQNHKYDPDRGSKVYSWATRVILNEMLQCILREQKRMKEWEKIVNDALVEGDYEPVETPIEEQY